MINKRQKTQIQKLKKHKKHKKHAKAKTKTNQASSNTKTRKKKKGKRGNGKRGEWSPVVSGVLRMEVRSAQFESSMNSVVWYSAVDRLVTCSTDRKHDKPVQ